MRYAVTGGTGFIGSRLIERLLKEGHEVNSIVRSGKTSAHSELVKQGLPITIFEYDGTVDSLVAAVEDVDHVVHLAAFFSTRNDAETVNSLVKSNIEFSVNLFTAVNSYNPSASVVSTSTFSAFDGEGNYTPQSFYASTKHAVEQLAAGFNIKATFLRLSDTYGSGDTRTKIMNLVRDALNDKREFNFQSPAEQRINLTHVDDVIDALIEAGNQAVNNPSGVNVYDLFYPENDVSLGEMADILNKDKKGILNFPLFGKITELPPQKKLLPKFSPKRTPESDLRKTVIGE